VTRESVAKEFENSSREQLLSALFDAKLEVNRLQEILGKANKNLYGSKSEKLGEQELFAFAPEVEAEPVSEITTPVKRTRKKRELPNTIPRERIEYDLESPLCPCCDREMAIIGEELSEELEFIPAQFKVIEHVRIKRACGTCKNGVYVPSLPPEVKPLERRQAGAGLLSQILISKYQDHSPLYRQEQIFNRHGINLPRKLLCGWVAGAAELLMPIYEALKTELLDENYLQADETHLKVQDPEVQGKLHTGYLWSILGPPNRVIFHYADSRAGEVPRELLKGFKGRLQTDAYAGYNKVFIPESCERIACMAHLRRKFIEARSSAKNSADKVISLIADLYKLERSIKDCSSEERLKRRKKRAFYTLKKLYRTIKQQRKSTLPESAYAKALNYAWEQRIPMLQYLRDGRYEIDNNLIENQMRPIALGRKNYLFAGSHEGARRAAVIYSILQTCKLNQVNPFDYLSDVFRRIHTRGVTLYSLLPQNWKPLSHYPANGVTE